MTIRLIQMAARIIAVMVSGIGVSASAQEDPADPYLLGRPSFRSWSPIALAAPEVTYLTSVDATPWIPELPAPSPYFDIRLTNNPITGTGSNTDGLPQSDLLNDNSRAAKSGTGMDALPSFRGIKGIKNLPGGVGTLLMANPHASGAWYPEQNTNQPGTTLSILRTDLQGAYPVYSKGANTFVLTGDVEITKVNTNAILPTTKQTFPSELFNIAVGMNYFHQFEGGNVGGVVFDMGTASDKPFQSGRDMLASGTAFLLMPQDEKGSWFVGVNASTNSQVLAGLPVPGGGYFYHPSEDFQAIMGFPFSVLSWKPHRDWQLQYVWAFLTTMHARAVYQPTPNWQLYGGFDWTNENWRLAERVNEENHFFYYEKRLATGLLWWFKPNMGLDLSTGWAFDRYFTEAHGFELKGDNVVEVGAGLFVAARIDLRF